MSPIPYIEPQRREDLDGLYRPLNVGELTYVLTDVVLNYLSGVPKYADYAEVLGALEATKLELYRRAVAPYEDRKRRENGDLEYPRPGGPYGGCSDADVRIGG